MAPTPAKLQDSAKKGQTSLFSFFKKAPSPSPSASPADPTASPAPAPVAASASASTSTASTPAPTPSLTPAASSSTTSSSVTASSTASSRTLIDDTKALSAQGIASAKKGPPPIAVTPLKAGDKRLISASKGKGKIMDDDEEEADIDDDDEGGPSRKKPKSSAQKGKKVVDSESEEDEEEDDMDMDSGGSEYSGSESMDSSESEELLPSSDDDEAPRKKVLRKGNATASKASASRSNSATKDEKPPLAAKKATPSVTPAKAPSPSLSNHSSPLSQFRADSPSKFSVGSADSDQSEQSYYKSSSSGSNAMLVALPEGVLGQGRHEHDSFEFLKPDKRKDKKGRRPDHPDYNPRTIYVPESFMKDQTPAMYQWWQFKSENMDTVLFFKVGKFYELFHMDADIGMSELDLIYMKGEKAHSGFPEVSYGKFASALVAKGYRVARVEQTETPEMLKERNEAKGAKKDKVVRRELCSVMSQGTRTFCHLDDLSMLEDLESAGISSSSSVLLCIIESISSDSDMNSSEAIEYGLCCVDTIIGTMTLAQFEDDSQRNRLRTFLSKYMPSEIVINNNNLSQEALGCLKLICPRAIIETLKNEEIIPAEKVIGELKAGRYYEPVDAKKGSEASLNWPAVMKAVIDSAAEGACGLILRSIGGVIWQLRRSLIDYEILSLGKVYGYVPPDNIVIEEVKGSQESSSNLQRSLSTNSNAVGFSPLSNAGGSDKAFMTLDAVALGNLEILQNNFDRTEKGSLWAFINRCNTAFGRRLLKDWLCRPLYRRREIHYRRYAIEELSESFGSRLDNIQKYLKEMPDLERLLSRVHSNGLKKDRLGHPDSRAVMYEMPVYSSRKIKDFADILMGFEYVVKVGECFSGANFSSFLLKKYLKQRKSADPDAMDTGSENIGSGWFPLKEIKDSLRYFREIFDEKQAKRDGQVKPKPGIDSNYDEAVAEVAELNSFFSSYLKELKAMTGISDLNYFGTGKDRYQVEVPMGQVGKVPKDWTSKSQKKTHRRYWNSTIEKKLSELVAAEEKLSNAQTDTLRAIFEKFDRNRSYFSDAITSMSILDALISLVSVSNSPNYVWPNILEKAPGQPSQIHIINGRHPMLENTMAARGDTEFIPNTVVLGGNVNGVFGKEYVSKLLLLTGPNMGGKSTLLRQTCLITILAQLGCKVPAEKCEITPVDRIFTRIGACDRILSGQSTFFVELAETATILNNATENSLCILDELGRGTATFDGTAIAHAVLHYLVHNSKSVSLFATHYHFLVEDWEMDPRVSLGFMDCMVQGPGLEGLPMSQSTSSHKSPPADAASEEVTFLYKLCNGSSPRSYGINVAKLAKLPDIVIKIAMEQSFEFETRLNSKRNGTNNGIDEKVKRRINAYFEKLVSIANEKGADESNSEEMVYYAKELWQRYLSEFK